MVVLEAAVLSASLKILLNKLAPLVIKEYVSILGVENDLRELQDLVLEINCFLESAIFNDLWRGSSLPWFRELNYVTYDVDDLVDEFHMEAEKHDVDGDNHKVSKYLCTKPKSFLLRYKAAKRIRSLKFRFAAIVQQRNDFNAIANSLPVSHHVHHVNSMTSEMPSLPILDVTSIFGRDKDKQHIISKLVEADDPQNIKIFSVIGLGGSGKTTLAKLIINDVDIIKNHFELRLWVDASDVTDCLKLLKKLFVASADSKYENYSVQHMVDKISKKLRRKRFLLVLDNLYILDRILWNDFMVYLKSGAPGSRILITTLSTNVAEALDSADLFYLPFLSEVSSWQLFKQSYGTAVEGLDSEFLKVGKEIVNKCGGVPLAIKVMAGVLREKGRREEWQGIRDSNLLDVEQHTVYNCLKLSYVHLPSHLKQCFTICSVFPQGCKIDKRLLIDQWIAHDIITPVNGIDYLEYSGHLCFCSLVKMSLLQDVDEKDDGTVECSMHDLVHDLALSMFDREISSHVNSQKRAFAQRYSYRYYCLIHELRYPVPESIFRKVRVMYVAKGDGCLFGKALKNARHLRSITIFYDSAESVPATILQIKYLRCLSITGLKLEILPKAVSNIWSLQALHINSPSLLQLPESIGKLKKLRTLNISGCSELLSLPDSVGDCHMISSLDLCYCQKLTELPSSIGKIKYLRELRLGLTKIERLPESIITLGNLECLDLWCCHMLVELPRGIKDLNKLEVLNLDGCNGLGSMPVGIGQLSRLQKLSLFVMGEDEESAKIPELGSIGRIGGELTIRNIPYGMDSNDAHKACLKLMTNLNTLTLNWSSNYRNKVDTENELAVLDALEPPSGIKGLEIHGYAGRRYMRWMQKQDIRLHGRFGFRAQCLYQFASLITITLSDFPNLERLVGLVELPCLEELKLLGMLALESISGGPFPSLMKLRMERLPSLGEVWMLTERTSGYVEDVGSSSSNTAPMGQLQIGNRLSNLWIKECPHLKVKPYLPSSLEYLGLHWSNEQQLLPLPGHSQAEEVSAFSFSHLKKLQLDGVTTSSSPGLNSGHGWELLQHLTALESLQIRKWDSLTELPESMQCLTTLKSVHIEGCSALCKLPEWLMDLQSLQKMTIVMCDILSGLPTSTQHLTALQTLSISDCRALLQLPEGLGGLCSLQALELRGLPSLSSLPESLVLLTSLQELEIKRCSALRQLPERLGELRSLCRFEISSLPGLSGLPQSMRRLTSLEELCIRDCTGLTSVPKCIQGILALKELRIIDCPALERRCERGKGEDWHLISHIPCLIIQ